ncbi:MAG: FKBP-type peptidyl-prolyl cis-trans isomerase FkpA [Muribaculaceae bacterium]|nr:FKBP-type peptidyl-prolyl cis-trans isomerase [Muribaculaceae bacterium]MCI9053851.1 FKBP-type peptidyl-prolyl cis-trans isomerase FkpA [Muribaculaceae bacterium]
MKKIIYGACAALVIMASACSKGGDAEKSAVPAQLSDSVSMIYGRTVGGYVLGDYQRFAQQNKSAATKNDIVKGIQLAFGNADSEGMMIGLQVGGNLLNEIKRFEEQGIDINREEVLKNFREVFMGDSLDMDALRETSGLLNTLLAQVERVKSEQEAAKAAEAPEAKANGSSADAFVKKIKASDPEVKTSASGLSYKIENKGEEPLVGDNSQVVVNYVGKLTDGTVFDQSPEGQPATFSPAGVIPGFAEGLKMLGKGGKATLYIPGDLAYGAQGVPQAGIGPNAMLIFEVEVVDVK